MYNGRHVSYVTPAGKMYSSRVSAGAWYVGKRWGLGDIGLIEDAIALGVLPSADAKKLKLLKTEEAAQKDRGWAAEYIGDYAKKLGIKFTKAQQKIIERNRRK